MVAIIITPEVINLSTAPYGPIVQGSDFFIELQVKDSDGGIVDLSGVDPDPSTGQIKCQFRNAPLSVAGTTIIGCPVPYVYISEASAGKLYLHLPSGETRYQASQVPSGVWDMEIVIDSHKYRVFQGTWAHDAKQVGDRYSVGA